MSSLEPYAFKVKKWPPPPSRENSKRSLFGIDGDNFPYIIRWESKAERAGWVGTTLQENKEAKTTATPQHINGEILDKIIKWWAETPLLQSEVKKAKENKDDD